MSVLTTHRGGRPVALAVEVGPVIDEPRPETAKRLLRRLRDWSKLVPEDAPALTAREFRNLPLGAFMRARAQLARDEDAALNLNPWKEPPPRAESRSLVELVDALTYVRAAELGESPAETIAETWGVSVRTAEGRIARARGRGYLTEVSGNQQRSTLTDQAFEVPEHFIAKHLPDALRDEWRRRATEHKKERPN